MSEGKKYVCVQRHFYVAKAGNKKAVNIVMRRAVNLDLKGMSSPMNEHLVLFGI